MSAGRTVWWAKDSAWWRRELVVELGEEFGADGPAVLDWLCCEAKAQNEGGWVKAGHRSIARGCFVELVTVGHVLSRAVTLGLLDDFSDSEMRFECRISGWGADQERGRAAARKAEQRAREEAEIPVPEPDPPDAASVTERDMSRLVTVRHAESLTGQDRTEEERTTSSLSPTSIADARNRHVGKVFDAWVAATERDAAKTKLTADRRRRIEKALASHGLDDCLAAVANIGADEWARGANDRGRRFDDVEHALGTTERLERWRDQRPRRPAPNADADYQATRQRRHEALVRSMAAGGTSMLGGAA